MHYVVLATYYKHARYELETFSDESKLRDYIFDFIEDEFKGIQSEISTDKLIEIAIEIGEQKIENQRGWGIRQVLFI